MTLDNRNLPRLGSAALLGTYVPRKCGLATFSKDLRDSIARHIGEAETTVIAMNDHAHCYDYPEEVRLQIDQNLPESYSAAAELLNIHEADAVFLQHEFGIFGGRDGSLVLDVVRPLRMPIITTLHTVLREPSSSQRLILREVVAESDRVVVMSNLAVEMLKDIYDVPMEKIALIPHGIPDVPFTDTHFFKDQFGVEGRKVLLTFGLLSPGKGIDVAIRAMPEIIRRHPEAIYIILGQTHPHILRHEGDVYRESLQALVKELGLERHVRFDNHFADLPLLTRYLSMTDIYVTPYRNKAQITSGTLAYAVGAGKAVVSTPYWHAEELLADGRGRLFPFGDSGALANEINDLLDNELETAAIRKRAYLHCRTMVWSEVGRSYVELARQVVAERRVTPRAISANSVQASDFATFPELDLSHLIRLSDDTSIFQHAIYATPNREHGYCIDDTARALIVALRAYALNRDQRMPALIDRYLSFMHNALNVDTGRFRNFMSYDRKWLEEQGSDDSHGRAASALGVAVELAPDNASLALAVRLFHDALTKVPGMSSPRSWAFSLIGLDRYMRRFGGNVSAARARSVIAEKLLFQFNQNQSTHWPWLEDVLTYDNAKLPHALMLSGSAMGSETMLAQGLQSLEWLVRLQVTAEFRVNPIGNRGWMNRAGRRAIFDQQPVEVMALIEACADAYRITRRHQWLDWSRLMLTWFLGNNLAACALYDYKTGGCRDGLVPNGANLNQGAESTLAWLTSLLTIMEIDSDVPDSRVGRAREIPRLSLLRSPDAPG